MEQTTMPDSPFCNKESLTAVIDSLDLGVIFVNEENNIIFINKAAEKIRDMKSEERLGTSILDCHGGKIRDRVLDVMETFKGHPDTSRHKIIKSKNHYFDNTYNVVRNENSEFLGVVLSSQDVTEKKMLEEQLKQTNEELEKKVKERTAEIQDAYYQLQIAQQQLIQSEKMSAIGQFVAGLAHEINNPLDGIQNCLQAIIADPADLEQTKKYAALSREGLYKIEMLVRKLLSYARTHSPEKCRVDINSILEDILSLTSLKFKTNKIEVEKELSPELPYILGDHHYLEQIFVNLILNSCDAMPDGGTLTVKTYVDNESLITIKVKDTGTGIPKKHLSKIFDPFFTTKKKSNGTGLGLYLSYTFVAQQNGRISVKSKEGFGTEFMVVFPVETKELKINYEEVLVNN
jgi:PAS domain S-box-containing protein